MKSETYLAVFIIFVFTFLLTSIILSGSSVSSFGPGSGSGAVPDGGGGGGGSSECTNDTDCGSCGSGTCKGHYKCVSGSCSSICDSSGTVCDTYNEKCNYICSDSGICDHSTYYCEDGESCFNGEDDDYDGYIDYCDGGCQGAKMCNAGTKVKSYIYAVGTTLTDEQCLNRCKSRGYSFGKIEPCEGGGSCVCDKIIECCSDSDCPSGSKCVNNFCVKDSECGKKNTPCCSSEPNNCVDYHGNEVQNGECGYPTQEAANDGHPWYCDNGKWVQTICTCLTDLYSSCDSLGFSGSCGSCSGTCADPPGSTIAMKFCYSDLYSSPQGPSQECNSGLNCCGDNYCHECCGNSDCPSNTPICDLSTYTCKKCSTNEDCKGINGGCCWNLLNSSRGDCAAAGTIYGQYLCVP